MQRFCRTLCLHLQGCPPPSQASSGFAGSLTALQFPNSAMPDVAFWPVCLN